MICYNLVIRPLFANIGEFMIRKYLPHIIWSGFSLVCFSTLITACSQNYVINPIAKNTPSINTSTATKTVTVTATVTSTFTPTPAVPYIYTYAGNGTFSFSGDGGLATAAGLYEPIGLAVDISNDIYFADCENHRVRKVNALGYISTVAGSAVSGYSGDGGPATSAAFGTIVDIAFDQTNSNLFIADSDNYRIRKVLSGGNVFTVVGTGLGGYTGDGGLATSAKIDEIGGIALDSAGNLYISDFSNDVIRKVNAITNIITTIVGIGVAGYGGDGGPATSASLKSPCGLAVDAAGNLYIADRDNERIRKVSPGGIITTVAGNGTAGFSGDGGAATSAELNAPFGVALDSSGDFYIADWSNNRVRKVSAGGVITTVAGSTFQGYSGDNGPATLARLMNPIRVAIDSLGRLYISDESNSRVRVVY